MPGVEYGRDPVVVTLLRLSSARSSRPGIPARADGVFLGKAGLVAVLLAGLVVTMAGCGGGGPTKSAPPRPPIRVTPLRTFSQKVRAGQLPPPDQPPSAPPPPRHTVLPPPLVAHPSH